MVRLYCLVPGCRHTRGPRKHDRYPLTEGAEWVCGEHWRHVSKDYRRAHARADRRMLAAYDRRRPDSDGDDVIAFGSYADLAEYMRARAAAARLWARCRRFAIERAMGIG